MFTPIVVFWLPRPLLLLMLPTSFWLVITTACVYLFYSVVVVVVVVVVAMNIIAVYTTGPPYICHNKNSLKQFVAASTHQQ